MVMLVALPGLFRNLPSATLAAIVIAAAIHLIEIKGVVRLLQRAQERVLAQRPRRSRGVAVLGVIRGVGLAVALSLLNFVRRSWRPHSAELVRVEGLKGYHDADRHPEGHRVPGLAPVPLRRAALLRQRRASCTAACTKRSGSRRIR